MHCFGKAVRHVPLASWEGCQLHTTRHLFKRHILYAIGGVSWGHGGGGRVGVGAGAGGGWGLGPGRVPWFGKAGAQFITNLGRRLRPALQPPLRCGQPDMPHR